MYRRRRKLTKYRKNSRSGRRRLKTVSRSLGSGDQKTKYCLDCGAPTQGCKDYCTEHVDQHPYVVSLIRKLQLSDLEEADVRRFGYQAIDDDSIILNDIIIILQNRGNRTVERLAREVVRDVDLIERYVEYLYQRGLVEIHENNKGRVVVGLVEPALPQLRYLR